MTKRILDLNASDMKDMGKREILQSIRAAEGRTIVNEIIAGTPPLFGEVSNVELASAFGTDIIVLNFYDVDKPKVAGLPDEEGEDVIREIKRLTGRFVGINLEPVDLDSMVIDERSILPPGRLATPENVQKAIDQDIDFIVLTGNPKTGVTNNSIVKAIKDIRYKVGDGIIIIAGKMHAAGNADEAGSGIVNKDVVKKFIDAGSDIIMLPAPGTVPGMTVEYVREVTEFVHSQGLLVLTAIGTSQEGADEDTIKLIALWSKMTGSDLLHIGDAGYQGFVVPENIMVFSVAIKGRRHTYRRMARSVNR